MNLHQLHRILGRPALAAASLLVGGWFAVAASNGLRAQDAPVPGPAAHVDVTLAAAQAKYDAAHWPQGERRGGLVLADIELPGLTGGEVVFSASGVSRRYADSAATPRVLVELAVSDTIKEAHAELLRHIAYVQSTKTLPTAAARGIRAGDLGYIGYGGKDGSKIAWLAFVVGNLELRVSNLAPDAEGAVDVKPLVELIAARALAQPVLAADVPLPRPTITRFVADERRVAAGSSLLLDVVAVDPTGKPADLDFIVGGSDQGQGYVEQDDQARWRFYATGIGRTTLTVKVLGRNGTTATKELVVEVIR